MKKQRPSQVYFETASFCSSYIISDSRIFISPRLSEVLDKQRYLKFRIIIRTTLFPFLKYL